MDEITDVTITAESADWLAAFARRLVDDGLAACANIIPTVRSIYTWEGKVEDSGEALAIIHTRKALVSQIIARADAEHPDDTPQVLAIPIADAHPGYRDWLITATATDPPSHDISPN